MRRLLPAALLALLLAGGVAEATLLRRFRLPELERYAEFVVVATVKETCAVRSDRPGGGILTEVTFGDLTVLKGGIRDATVRWTFAGGTLGGRTLRVHGVPQFAPGERCLLFVAPDLDWICPVVGWEQGRYRIVTAAEGAGEVVQDSAGRPVYGFFDGYPVVVPPSAQARPMTLDSLLSAVRETIRARAEREGAR